ncbi:hypothetical protein MRB53_039624 [Persea americana]|nr:hypothetical protein MRB53_039624 [Persea americana]
MECQRNRFVKGALFNGRYETVSPLNQGSFGQVFVAWDRVARANVALKCLTKASGQQGGKDNNGFQVDDRSEELEIHSGLGYHPNIVNLRDSFETSTHMYLVLEYCSQGDLYEAIRQDKGPKETEHVRDFMLQLVSALEFLHAKGIAHRDIKPENIFLSESGRLKLGDFGLATKSKWSHEAAVGSDRYMAPEQYDPGSGGLSPAQADIWSAGICLLNILFSRNPFGVPAPKDPLYLDFVRDKQSLFDVFPNMSQDTFEVLTHCLAIDPAKRSLTLVKEALNRVISFTTDDETLDEFCTEDREVVAVTANREPLRTPSVTSPTNDQTKSFPWAQALRMTSPKQPSARQLSVIHDTESYTEDLFPASEASHDWVSKADTRSIDSAAESGFCTSDGNGKQKAPSSRTRPVQISGSLPIFGGGKSAFNYLFSKKKPFESKSWSDLYEEEEEERAQLQRQTKSPKGSQLRPILSQDDSSDDGRSTPRACLAELRNNSSKNSRPTSKAGPARTPSSDSVSKETGFVFEEQRSTPVAIPSSRVGSPTLSPPRRASFVDKWSALGDRRRGTGTSVLRPVSPLRPSEPLASPTSTRKKIRDSATMWRRNIGSALSSTAPQTALAAQPKKQSLDHSVWQQKEWNVSKDWRKSQPDLPANPRSSAALPLSSQLDGSAMHSDDLYDASGSDGEDSEGAEWIGGWKELHL